MNVRVKFAKYGNMKFIGHLDVMRYFQKAIKRANLPIVYSMGYHPHQIMSFANPLGVGVTSESEYVDLELTNEESISVEEITKRLDETMTEGFKILGCRILPDPLSGRKRETAMSLITAADYLVSLKDGYAFLLSREETLNKLAEFFALEQIPIVKEVKKSGREEEMNVKNYFYAQASSKEEMLSKCEITANYYADCNLPVYVEETPLLAEQYENGISFALRLSSGSSVNIKPEVIMEAFCGFCGCEFLPFAWQYHRFGMYTGTPDAFSCIF